MSIASMSVEGWRVQGVNMKTIVRVVTKVLLAFAIVVALAIGTLGVMFLESIASALFDLVEVLREVVADDRMQAERVDTFATV